MNNKIINIYKEKTNTKLDRLIQESNQVKRGIAELIRQVADQSVQIEILVREIIGKRSLLKLSNEKQVKGMS